MTEENQDLNKKMQDGEQNAKEKIKANKEWLKTPAGKEAQDTFVRAVLSGSVESLKIQPSNSSSHRLAMQQALGRVAEVVHSYRQWLEIWGKECIIEDFQIWTKVRSPEGKVTQHGITLFPLLSSMAPVSEVVNDHVAKVVQDGMRHVCWALAVLSRDTAELHAFLEKELLKEVPTEPEIDISNTRGESLGQ